MTSIFPRGRCLMKKHLKFSGGCLSVHMTILCSLFGLQPICRALLSDDITLEYDKNSLVLLSVTVFTVRLHVMQRTVLLSEFCLSVCLSVRQMRVL